MRKTFFRLVGVIFLALINVGTYAQDKQDSQAHPYKDYFMFPIRPGEKNFLAGTMGELRPRHFHGGLDIKTGGRTGLPVFAAADGYVSRIKVSKGGYGHALYIQHPNGATTTYAHLDRYAGKIAKYVLEQQYKQQSFEIELFPKKGMFPIKKGETIAFSGNTGSSQGPHLHFEIRDRNQAPVNPLRFGFDEIVDNIPPSARILALTTLESDARINGAFGRFEFVLQKVDGIYKPTSPIKASGRIGAQIWTYDRMTGSPNRNGVPDITLRVDGQTIFEQHVDRIPFKDNPFIKTLCDYATEMRTRRRFNKLYIDDGNELALYKNVLDNGVITVNGTENKKAEITLADAYGNETIVKFELRGDDRKTALAKVPYYRQNLMHNTLILSAKLSDSTSNPQLYANREAQQLEPAYRSRSKFYYLWDMRQGIPDSLFLSGQMKSLGFETAVEPKHDMTVYTPSMELRFPKRALFDTLYLKTDYYYDSLKRREHFSVHETSFPLRSAIAIKLRPSYGYDTATHRAFSVSERRINYIGGKWTKNGTITFRTRTLGDFTIAPDTVPPTIRPVRVTTSKAMFSIRDNLSGISDIKAEIGGKWLLMHYDPKTRRIWSERLDKSKKLKGKLTLVVTDYLNNKSVFEKTL
ncbi:M23 family metallopeptidase [Fulvitalea axinellae]